MFSPLQIWTGEMATKYFPSTRGFLGQGTLVLKAGQIWTVDHHKFSGGRLSLNPQTRTECWLQGTPTKIVISVVSDTFLLFILLIIGILYPVSLDTNQQSLISISVQLINALLIGLLDYQEKKTFSSFGLGCRAHRKRGGCSEQRQRYILV